MVGDLLGGGCCQGVVRVQSGSRVLDTLNPDQLRGEQDPFQECG